MSALCNYSWLFLWACSLMFCNNCHAHVSAEWLYCTDTESLSVVCPYNTHSGDYMQGRGGLRFIIFMNRYTETLRLLFMISHTFICQNTSATLK